MTSLDLRSVSVLAQIPPAPAVAQIQRLVAIMMRRDKRWPSYDINLHFIDNETIRKLKRKYFGLRRITDVISLNYTTIPGVLEGDIFISVERARQQAVRYGVTAEQETLRLIAHGVLHLLGHVDDHERQRRQMSALEDQALLRLRKSRTKN